MQKLLTNCRVVNVFTGMIDACDVLIENDLIVGVGDYAGHPADVVSDVGGRYVCPGLIDGHIHIESTMLSPAEFARTVVPHGTTTVVADPHEIANVSGRSGVGFILDASENLPLTVYVTLPSCVPATPFCESGAALHAEDLEAFYAHPRVIGLGEVMNYPGVIAREPGVMRKISEAHAHKMIVNGHAPLLTGRDLDKYISAGVNDDHECTSAEEAMERIRKGQRVMIRQGTAARNLASLLPLFEEPWAHRCLLVTDDKHPADLKNNGHIDSIIRQAVSHGKNPVTAIRMATVWAAECFGLRNVGAIAPGYRADLIVVDDIETMSVRDVYHGGELVARDGEMIAACESHVRADLTKTICNSFYMAKLTEQDFMINEHGRMTSYVIRLIKNELLTLGERMRINFDVDNGIDVSRDVVKIAVLERHLNTGHKGLGFVAGTGMTCGAIAASVSHDSHNLIIIGQNEEDMVVAGNRVRLMHGGCAVVRDGEILADMPLPLGGLMTDQPADVIIRQNEALRESVHQLGVPQDVELFMAMAFMSLPVIPHLKLTTRGLIDVNRQELVPLVIE